MLCRACGEFERRNVWTCTNGDCRQPMVGGMVVVTGISGSGVDEHLERVADEARAHGHEDVRVWDIGDRMRFFAEDDNPEVRWDRILDADESMLRHLRARAFHELADALRENPTTLFLVDLHLSFRWRAYLRKGFSPHLLEDFEPHVRCFINIIGDLTVIQGRLASTAWGQREVLELLVWRDEELFLTTLFADACGRVRAFAVAASEPASTIEHLVWHPEVKKVYLSFPMTALIGAENADARAEIESFRDRLREFLIVFDPAATADYNETYQRPEMQALRKQVGEATEERDYRFIDQADAVVVYYPRKVPSQGVDAEMNHARRTGKDIFLYAPEDLGGGPFAVPASHSRSNVDEFIDLLKREVGTPTDPEAFHEGGG